MASPLNFLLIFTDQQQQKLMGCYGHPVVRTSRIDAFAQEGAVFENAVCAQPVCTASRASLLTGTFGHTHGCVRNNQVLTPDIPTYGEIFGPHGYRCGYVGKWHCGNENVPQRGFEGFFRSMEGKYVSRSMREMGMCSTYDRFLRDRGVKPESGGPTFNPRETCDLPEELSKPAFLVAQADEFFRSQNSDKPFFLTVSIVEPHPPYFGPNDDMYDLDQVKLPDNYNVSEEEMAGWSRRTERFRSFYYDCGHNIITSDPEDVRTNLRRYYGLITQVDTCVGKILDLLEAYGFAENTVVVFTSDHGDMFGSHQIVDKGMMFEESVKVPFILRDPQRRAESRQSEVVNLVDILPTFLDIAGLPIPQHLQGRSLVPILDGAKSGIRDFTISEWNGFLQAMHARNPIFEDVLHQHIRCIITENWKLVLSPGDTAELYDLVADPLERRSVLRDSGYRPIIDDLYDKLRAWQEETNDPLEIVHPLK